MGAISKRDDVLDAICAALRAMTTGGGYTYTVRAASVVRDPVNILAVPDTNLPFFVVEPSPQGDTRYMPANQVQHDFAVLVTARITAPGIAPDRKSKAWERLIADLEKALTVDITLGGLCSDVRLGEPSPLTGVGPDNIVIVTQPLTVKLWRTYGRP